MAQSIVMDSRLKILNSGERMNFDKLAVDPPVAPAGGTQCSVKVVRTDAEFDALEPAWNELILQTDVSVFQTFEWLRTWWTHFGGGFKLHCLVFITDGRIVGIAPMFQQVVKTGRLKIATWLRFIGCGISDYLDVIMGRGYEETVLNVFAHYLQLTSSQWDVFEIVDVNERSSVFRLLPHL